MRNQNEKVEYGRGSFNATGLASVVLMWYSIAFLRILIDIVIYSSNIDSFQLLYLFIVLTLVIMYVILLMIEILSYFLTRHIEQIKARKELKAR